MQNDEETDPMYTKKNQTGTDDKAQKTISTFGGFTFYRGLDE